MLTKDLIKTCDFKSCWFKYFSSLSQCSKHKTRTEFKNFKQKNFQLLSIGKVKDEIN